MGLSAGFLRELLALKQRGLIEGTRRVVEIGAQQLSNEFLRSDGLLDELFQRFEKLRPDLGVPIKTAVVEGIELMHDHNPSSRDFWRALGLEYKSVEYDGHRDSIAIDLNKDDVPVEMRGQYDLVVNSGTSEHVANQGQCFRVIHDLCKVGGLMIHEVPGGGLLNHGLVNYNPKFFWHLCRDNNYVPIALRVAVHGADPIPDNVFDSNVRYSNGIEVELRGVLVPNISVFAIVRKISGDAFQIPLDVPPELMR
jgi:hypothetical protein